MKIQALFNKGSAAKAAPKKAAKGTTVVRPSGSKATKGWLGGEGGATNLDKWYGEYVAATMGSDLHQQSNAWSSLAFWTQLRNPRGIGIRQITGHQ